MKFDSLTVKEHPENRTTAPHVLPLYATSSFDFENIEENTGLTVLGNYTKQLDIKYEITQQKGTKITLVFGVG